MNLTLNELIEHHRKLADSTHGAAVGRGGGCGTFESRQTHYFHADAVETLNVLKDSISYILDHGLEAQ